MKRLILILGAILIITILYPSPELMAQDPNDPGKYDTLYFSPGGMRSMTGDTLYVWPDSFPQDVTVHLNFWNDNPISCFLTPFVDSCNSWPYNVYLDPEKNNQNEFPKCFEGSRVAYFEWQYAKVWYYPEYMFLTAATENPLPPGDGLLATLIFTVLDTLRICLDTSWLPPSNYLEFRTPEKQNYVPVFEKRTFVVSYCGYNCGDPNNDGITNIVDVVCIVNYVLRSGTPLCYEKSGDMNCDDEVNITDIVYLVNYLFEHGPPPGYCP